MESGYSLLLLFCWLLHTARTSEQDCDYQYLRQPPSEIMCNPYSSGIAVLKLQCHIVLRLSVDSQAEIRWFYGDKHITNSFLPLVEISEEMTSMDKSYFTSTLTLDGSAFNDSYTGEYYCQIVVDGRHTEPSNKLILRVEDEYIIYHPCLDSDIQATDDISCADFIATTGTIVETTTKRQTTPLQTSTVPTTSHSTSISSSSSSPTPDVSTAESSTTLPLWVYALVGVAVALILVMVVLVITVGIICHKVRIRRSMTKDQEKGDTEEDKSNQLPSSPEGLKEGDVKLFNYSTDPAQKYDLSKKSENIVASESSSRAPQNQYQFAGHNLRQPGPAGQGNMELRQPESAGQANMELRPTVQQYSSIEV